MQLASQRGAHWAHRLASSLSRARSPWAGSRRAMSTSRPSESVPLLLGPHQVNERIQRWKGDKGALRILDATWFMPNVQRSAEQEFLQGPRIPGAAFWDVDKVASLKQDVDASGASLNPLGLPHMMPTADVFAQAASRLGITRSTHVIVYDTHGVFSSPRTAFTFYAFGHPAVSILDGGLPGWRAAGLPLEEGAKEAEQNDGGLTYPSDISLLPGLIRSYDEVVANARMGPRGQTVFDARAAGRFDGTAPEPRPELSSGHIPHSLSLPFGNLLDVQKDPRDPSQTFTTLKPQTELWRTIAATLSAPSGGEGGLEAMDKLRQASSAAEPAAINTCGSGMTAAILWLSLYQLGIQSSVYDESWTGWAQRKTSVIDKTEPSGNEGRP